MQSLIVPGKLDSLEKIRKFILKAAKNAGLEKARAYKLSLAVDEIATNIINYGYVRAGMEGDLTIEADQDEHALTITLDDTSGYFDPTLKPPPEAEKFNQPLAERAIGGWGVYLAIQSVDQFNYHRLDDHNYNVFIMYRATHGDLLAIDSYKQSCSAIAEHLINLGYSVACVESGQKAVEQMHQQKYEMVLLDLPLQDKGAEEFIKEVKADNALRGIPLLILAEQEQIKEAENCINAGAEDYIVMPFSPVVLKARVSAILERQRVRLAEQALKDSMKNERDLQIGRKIQLFFLPGMLPQPAGWEIAAHFEPGHEVSGDFYDAFKLPDDSICLIMGDVFDQGITAALFMVLFRSLLRSFAQHQHTELMKNRVAVGAQEGLLSEGNSVTDGSGTTLLNSISLTNNYILINHDSNKVYATIFFAILDPTTGALVYINAGYEPPLIVNHGAVRERLKSTGSPVGMMPDAEFETQSTHLNPGDTLLVYSDGVIEARNPSGQAFGRHNVLKQIEDSDLAAGSLLARIESGVQAHITDMAQSDDLTMLAVKRVV